MKFIMFSVLLFTMPSSYLIAGPCSRNPAYCDRNGKTDKESLEEAQQPTVCSIITDFEERIRKCIDVGQMDIGDCELLGPGLGGHGQLPDDVRYGLESVGFKVLFSCRGKEDDLPCVLTAIVSAKAEHQCAASESN